MHQLEEIEGILQRYVLRIDNEAKYSEIIEIPQAFQKKMSAFNLNSNHHIQAIKRNGIFHEVNYVNLRKVILNPKRFLIIDHNGRIAFFNNSDFKNRLEVALEGKHITSFAYIPKRLMKLLDYQYILSDKIIEEICFLIKRRLISAINDLKTKEKPGYSGEFSFLYDKHLYLCCNKLGAHHFDDLILEFFQDFTNHKSAYFNVRFTESLLYFKSSKPSNNSLFLKAHEKTKAIFLGGKDSIKSSNRFTGSTFEYGIVILLFVLAFCIYLFAIKPKQDQKVEFELPIHPKISFFQAFLFDQKRVIENQYSSSSFSQFSPCDFKIENTQFENYSTNSDRHREILLINKSQKDIIVIWANDQGLAYSFLSANGGYSKLRPVKGMLKLYAGNEPQSTIQTSQDENTAIDFKFGTFTRQDSLLLLKEFDLEKIGPTDQQFSLFDKDGTVDIKRGLRD